MRLPDCLMLRTSASPIIIMWYVDSLVGEGGFAPYKEESCLRGRYENSRLSDSPTLYFSDSLALGFPESRTLLV